MGGFFAAASKEDCLFDLFFGTDYHSHLGTRRGGMAVYGKNGFDRSIHNIENSPFRTKFEKDVNEMEGNMGIGCISDYEPQPLLVRSHHGTYSITTVGKINNTEEIVELIFKNGNSHFFEMSNGDINPTELVSAIINQKGVKPLVTPTQGYLACQCTPAAQGHDALGAEAVVSVPSKISCQNLQAAHYQPLYRRFLLSQGQTRHRTGRFPAFHAGGLGR